MPNDAQMFEIWLISESLYWHVRKYILYMTLIYLLRSKWYLTSLNSIQKAQHNGRL